MWIITKTNGIFNTDHFVQIDEIHGSTYGLSANSENPILIANKLVLHKIFNALKNNDDFVEVE